MDLLTLEDEGTTTFQSSQLFTHWHRTIS